jgi:hypothetical protein
MANRRGKGESEPITLGQTLAVECRFRRHRRAALMSPRPPRTRPRHAPVLTRPVAEPPEPSRSRHTAAPAASGDSALGRCLRE